MYEQPAGVAVRTSLAFIAQMTSAITEADTAPLHERICVAVDELKAIGWSVERILIRLKQLASEVGFWPPRESKLTMANIDRREAIWDEIVKECINRYYGQSSLSDPNTVRRIPLE